MSANRFQYAYGPVPSRRLGQSLGINNIPPKVCTYSCVYCQVGRTKEMTIDRRAFYEPEKIVRSIHRKVDEAKESQETIDYLTFVPDGEPTLDSNLGKEIASSKSLSIPIGVITNSSLIWRNDVRQELGLADWVSLKIDTTQEEVWRKIDRPHRALNLDSILDGILAFRKTFEGTLVTETMLVKNLNESENCIRKIADFLSQIQPDVSYLSIPTRPPAEKWVSVPDEEMLNRAYYILAEKAKRVEYLIDYEGDSFGFTGDVEENLLSITAVHPMREEAVGTLLSRAGADWQVVHQLISHGDLVETKYRGHKFYLRRFRKPAHKDVSQPGQG